MNPIDSRIQAMLEKWKKAGIQTVEDLPSGFGAAPSIAVEDGATYDQMTPEKPDFVKKDEAGWETLGGLSR